MKLIWIMMILNCLKLDRKLPTEVSSEKDVSEKKDKKKEVVMKNFTCLLEAVID